MVVTHITHELSSGILTIDTFSARQNDVDIPDGPETPENAENCATIRFCFESRTDGARFDAEYTHTQLCDMCPIFAISDELWDILSERPEVAILDNLIMIRYLIAGKKKTYPANLKLLPSKYNLTKDEIIALCRENAELRSIAQQNQSKLLTDESWKLKLQNDIELLSLDVQITQAIQILDGLRHDQTRAESQLRDTVAKNTEETTHLTEITEKITLQLRQQQILEHEIANTVSRLKAIENMVAIKREELRDIKILITDTEAELLSVEMTYAKISKAVGIYETLFGKARHKGT
jgi:hypothetical protein